MNLDVCVVDIFVYCSFNDDDDDDCMCLSLKYLSNALDNRTCAIQAKSNNCNLMRNCTVIGWYGRLYICLGINIDIILVIEDSINAPKKVRGTTVVICNMYSDISDKSKNISHAHNCKQTKISLYHSPPGYCKWSYGRIASISSSICAEQVSAVIPSWDMHDDDLLSSMNDIQEALIPK